MLSFRIGVAALLILWKALPVSVAVIALFNFGPPVNHGIAMALLSYASATLFQRAAWQFKEYVWPSGPAFT